MPPAVPLHFGLEDSEESLLLGKKQQQDKERRRRQKQQQQSNRRNETHDDQSCYSYLFGGHGQRQYSSLTKLASSSSSSLTSLTCGSSESDSGDETATNTIEEGKNFGPYQDSDFKDKKCDDGDGNFENICRCRRCSSLWQWYYERLLSHPVTVKSITAFVLMILADLCAQAIEHCHRHGSISTAAADAAAGGGGDVDWLRTLRFGMFGLMGGCWTHYYYYYLDSWLPPTPSPWTCTTFTKVFIDQFVQAPVMLALIVMGLAFMEGKGWVGMVGDMDDQYLSALLHNWTLWLPATLVNMAFVAPSLRVGFDNLIFFGWTIYLSIVLNK